MDNADRAVEGPLQAAVGRPEFWLASNMRSDVRPRFTVQRGGAWISGQTLRVREMTTEEAHHIGFAPA